jgi:hypothetical protein
MNLRVLEEYSKQVPREKIEKLEEVLLRISREAFFNSGINNQLTRTVERIFKKDTQSYIDEFYPKGKKISVIDELVRNKKFIEEIDEPTLNLIAYRPDNIKMLVKQEKEIKDSIKQQTEKALEAGFSIKEAYSRSFRDLLFPGYFNISDYHDGFALKIFHAIKEKDVEELKNLLEKGFDHIVWTNICEDGLRKIVQFSPIFSNPNKFKKIHVNPYPYEFFRALTTLDANLPFLREGNKNIYKEIIDEVITAGRYYRIGNHPFNGQKLRNKCKEFLTLFPSRTSKLIENYYLDRQITAYSGGLSSLESLIQSSIFKNDLEVLKEYIKDALPNLPTTDHTKALSIWFSLKKHFPPNYPYVPRSKNELKPPYSLYWSLLRRRSLDYIAATILLECLCHIQHDFPAEKWIEFAYLNAQQAKDYRILEVPTKLGYKELAKKFGLSPKKLRKYHASTMFVCRLLAHS